jgi:hypothetical protein
VGRFTHSEVVNVEDFRGTRERNNSELGGSELGSVAEFEMQETMPAKCYLSVISGCRRFASKFEPQFRVRDQPGHSAPLIGLGALMLYVAWFSFNAGSGVGGIFAQYCQMILAKCG